MSISSHLLQRIVFPANTKLHANGTNVCSNLDRVKQNTMFRVDRNVVEALTSPEGITRYL